MELYSKLLLSLLVCFFVCLALSPLIIWLITRQNVKQVILEYVDNHKSKAGTPTMGGIIFIVAISIVPFMFFSANNYTLAATTILVFVSYGLIGFLDDFIKFKFKRNLGLRAYQKIFFQLSVSIIISVFAYKNQFVGSTLILPFSGKLIDIGYAVVPLNILVILATTNSVNLTDGLDGLASGTTLSFLVTFFDLIIVLTCKVYLSANILFLQEISNINVVVCASIGAIICYLLFNCFPAKIFMGDTGSLSLGALVAMLCIFTRTTLYLPIIGIMFVLSSVSVIMQVSYYKLTKKRIFLMAPLHHHFEKKGVHEVRISVSYMVVTFVVGAFVVLLELL